MSTATAAKPERVHNADLSKSCVWCDRAFPRMYMEKGEVVCKVGPACRPFNKANGS